MSPSVEFTRYEESGGILPKKKYQDLVELLHSADRAEPFSWTLAQVEHMCSSTGISIDDELRFLYTTLNKSKKLYSLPSPSDHCLFAECLIISGRFPDLATLKAYLPNIFSNFFPKKEEPTPQKPRN